MSNQYDNTNSGAAFLKDNANPKAPKWAGPINVEGKEYEIAVWEKTSKAGKPFLSFKLDKPRPKTQGNYNQAKAPYKGHDSEEIPF